MAIERARTDGHIIMRVGFPTAEFSIKELSTAPTVLSSL